MKPQLKLMADCPSVSNQACAAKNIKEELRCAFPGIKFSVTSDAFSMGDSVDIRWTDGPTTKEVDALVKDYCNSEFDGMQDLSTYVTKAKHAYGYSKYVHTSRNTRELQEAIETALKPFFKAEDHYQLFNNQNIHYRLAARTSLKAGQKFKGVRRKEDTRAASCFSEFYEVELTDDKPELSKLEPGQVIKTKHTQKGYDLFVVKLPCRVSRDAFRGFLDQAKGLGGWYSSFDLNGAVPGFQFRTELSATAFLDVVKGAAPSPESANESYQIRKLANGERLKQQAASLRALAEGMEKQIDSKLNSAIGNQNPTPRRIRIAEGMRLDGEHLQRVQAALRKIADGLDAGAKVTEAAINKSSVSEALRGRGDAALVQWLKAEVPKIEEDPKVKRIREIENGLVGQKIPGFFPTPPEIVDRMKAHVGLDGTPLILEPSAGSGAIACALNGGSVVHCCEIRPTLAELLKLKGQRVVAGDFLEYNPGPIYDIVLMNPPFENKQAVGHVFHAWECLKSGGRLVAILPESVRFNSTSDYQELRDWINEHGGELEDIEAGAFERSGTNVKTQMLICDKP